MNKHMKPLHPVILCGGSGTRLWPASRKDLPKQFLTLLGDESLFQKTVSAVAKHRRYAPPVIVANADYRFMVEQQLEQIGVRDARIILEPDARNTAPAIALAAIVVAGENPDALALVMPSDHLISNHDAFHDNVATAVEAAASGGLLTFGINPDRPETGYGYIRAGEAIDAKAAVRSVERFIEKPNRERAEWMLETGGHYWNSGMFLFPVSEFLDELAIHEPRVFAAVFEAIDNGESRRGAFAPHPEIFARSPRISIDYAVMEKTRRAMVIPAGFGWSDIGSWTALADAHDADDRGNAGSGDALMEDCEGTFVHAGSRLVTAVGVRDHVVVETADAVLVAPKDRAQDVKAIVETLKAADRPEAEVQAKVRRPWGTYQGVHLGESHQVKHIVVDPGQKLSLQYHHHRSEHWVVVAGEAEVSVNGETRFLTANESVHIPKLATHRLFNPGGRPLHLIEVQCGDYLGEDDIVRIEDDYGRTVSESTMAAAE